MLASIVADFRRHPVVATLEYGSLATCVALLIGVVAAIATGNPDYPGGIWLAVVVVGAVFVCFWTVLWPVYERLRS
ncbi:hypothetical protein [Halovivax gelatinilyticus]|uniref:hypothetical protein n=1 Tax=Halovivax gelatinilyticus TaxID=2961597 RepID=UPI0020CA63CC|nr:hypothetical protein [Halovivax gelatinilyticus]